MRRGEIIIGCLWLIGLCSGYYLYPQKDPYKLDYKNLTLNLQINYTRIMLDPYYPAGEKYLANDMQKEFNKLGYNAKLYSLEETFANRNFLSGFDIYLRPYPELDLGPYHEIYDKDRIAVLYETTPYLLSHLRNVDIIFTGSLQKHKELKELGLNSHFLPQFTRTDKFYPAYNEEYKSKIIFIGNQWPDAINRPIVEKIKNTGLEVDIYGNGYEKILTGEYKKLWKANQILPDELKYYYSSADIVLNDTRPDMIEAGFISNRIFDVTACKGFLISDYIPEIEEIYGDTIPMYKNEEELKSLIEYYLVHPEERKEKAERAYQITIQNYSAEKIIKNMTAIMEQYRQNHHMKGKGDK